MTRPRGVGQPARSGVVIEVRGPGGEPPYIVRWTDSGMLALYFPGRDAHVDGVRDARLAGHAHHRLAHDAHH